VNVSVRLLLLFNAPMLHRSSAPMLSNALLPLRIAWHHSTLSLHLASQAAMRGQSSGALLSCMLVTSLRASSAACKSIRICIRGSACQQCHHPHPPCTQDITWASKASLRMKTYGLSIFKRVILSPLTRRVGLSVASMCCHKSLSSAKMKPAPTFDFCQQEGAQ
jgi:hypothetical protein